LHFLTEGSGPNFSICFWKQAMEVKKEHKFIAGINSEALNKEGEG
jgi:hypothetical protein